LQRAHRDGYVTALVVVADDSAKQGGEPNPSLVTFVRAIATPPLLSID
jgi:hypothetical protein